MFVAVCYVKETKNFQINAEIMNLLYFCYLNCCKRALVRNNFYLCKKRLKMNMKRRFLGFLIVLLTCCVTVLATTACGGQEHVAEQDRVGGLSDRVWTFAKAHPDGFTLHLLSMTEPTEGIAVSYADTQNSHSRLVLDEVVKHALLHDGYVGGWLDRTSGLYYFDSTRLFSEDSLNAAIRFGVENGQSSVFVLSSNIEIPLSGQVAKIVKRGVLRVGTTGDYRPLSFREPSGNYWGFGIEMVQKIAERMGVLVEFVPTSWPTLSEDVQAEPQLFDLALGGITITAARKETMLMSNGYLGNGKTILCRSGESGRFRSLADVNRPGVIVMVNPGGLNEKFARDSLSQATVLVHERNEEIPVLVAEGKADVMITEITEAPWYVKNDARLSAPLLEHPFTRGEIGVLMRQGQDDLMAVVNDVIALMKADGTLRQLHRKYGLVYVYE